MKHQTFKLTTIKFSSNVCNTVILLLSIVSIVFTWFITCNWFYTLLSFIPWYAILDHPEHEWWNETEAIKGTTRKEKPKREVWHKVIDNKHCGHNHRSVVAAMQCGREEVDNDRVRVIREMI